MVIQHLLFPKPGICTDEPLYFRRNARAYYSWTDDVIYFDRDGSVELDTYFNGISAEKLFKYTVIQQLSIRLSLQGIFRITLMRKEKLGSEIFTEVMDEIVVSTDGEQKDITIPFTSKTTSGMYCVKLLSVEDAGKYFGGAYLSEVPEEQIRPVKIGVDICTFKREKFVEKNIQSVKEAFLNNPESPMYGHLEIFISDNAKTLPPHVGDSELVHIFQNKNVGGAGGFTRGLIEIIRNGNPYGITHALLMDDDIVVDPEAFYRTYTLLSLLKEEYAHAFVGGAMLRLDHQNIQVESGAVWNKGNLISLKSGLDLRQLDACLYNELEETVDYNAWWYCTIPIENVRADNLPLPIFIRGDDVEYGLRNTKKLILMNGICVWHEPFENKYSSVMYYYILRNRLIDNSIRKIPFSKKHFLKEFKEHVMTEINCMRYANAYLLVRGVNDFFKGIDWLKSQDGEQLHQEIMGIGYKLRYVDELDFLFSYPLYEQSKYIPEDKGFVGFLKKVAIKLSWNGVFLRGKKDVIVPTVGVNPRQLVCAKRALNYDITSKKGFVTEKSLKKIFSHYYRYLCTKWKVKLHYKKAVEEYQRRGKEIMSLDFWNHYLGIEASTQPLPPSDETKMDKQDIILETASPNILLEDEKTINLEWKEVEPVHQQAVKPQTSKVASEYGLKRTYPQTKKRTGKGKKRKK